MKLRQILIVAIFGSAMLFFFACAVSRAEGDATWTLYGNITGLPIDGPFSTAEECQADRAVTVPPTDYTCYHTGSRPTPRPRAEETTDDDHRGPPSVFIVISHRHDELRPVEVFSTEHECTDFINQQKAPAEGASAKSGAAGLACAEYSRINLDNGGEDDATWTRGSRAETPPKLSFNCTLMEGLPKGATFRCEKATTETDGGWILTFHQLGKSAPRPTSYTTATLNARPRATRRSWTFTAWPTRR